MLFKIAIIETPKLRAVGSDKKVQTTSVRQLVIAITRFGAGNGSGKKGGHEGIVLAKGRKSIPSDIPALFPIGAEFARI